MDKERMAELEKIEAHGAENGWVTPMTEEDKAYFAYFRSVFKRYKDVYKRQQFCWNCTSLLWNDKSLFPLRTIR